MAMDCVCSGFDTPYALSNDRLACCGFDETAAPPSLGNFRAVRLPHETAPIGAPRCAILAMTTGSWWGTLWRSPATNAAHAGFPRCSTLPHMAKRIAPTPRGAAPPPRPPNTHPLIQHL